MGAEEPFKLQHAPLVMVKGKGLPNQDPRFDYGAVPRENRPATKGPWSL
jgi:hypothetical protein